MSEKILNEQNSELSNLEFYEQQIFNLCRMQAKAIAETGKLLKAIKDGKIFRSKGFNTFKEYIDESCGTTFPFGASQAYKYIRVYEEYGPRLEQYGEKYGKIDLEILNMFRTLPAEEFEKLADENDFGKISVKEAEKLNNELKNQLEKANEQISLLQSTANEKEEELSTVKSRLSTAAGRIENLEKEIDELQSRPVDVLVKEPDESVINDRVEKKVEEQTAADKAKIKELKKNINELEKQAESAESLKSDYENRLKELDEQLKNAGQADAALIEYKFYFEEMQNNLKKFIGVLGKIDDADKKEKFKGAAVKFLNAVLEELGK